MSKVVFILDFTSKALEDIRFSQSIWKQKAAK